MQLSRQVIKLAVIKKMCSERKGLEKKIERMLESPTIWFLVTLEKNERRGKYFELGSRSRYETFVRHLILCFLE